MSFVDCILKNSSLKSGQANSLVAEYEEIFNRYRESMGDDTAAAAAAQKYITVKSLKTQKNNENIIRHALATTRIVEDVNARAERVAEEKKKAGRLAKLWGKSDKATATRRLLEDVYTRHTGIERKYTTAISELVEGYRSKLAGLTQDVEGFKNVVRVVLSGEKVDDADLTKNGMAIRRVFDMMHKQYENAGGVIGKLDNFFPQSHDAKLVGRVSAREWVDYIMPLLDRNKMIDLDTGLPFSDAKLRKVLLETHEGIRTNGLNHLAERVDSGKQTSGTGVSVSKRHSTARFLHFKNADAFFDYNNRFGYGDAGLFDTVMGHIHSMTRDIALMEELGPNPTGVVETLKMNVESDGFSSPQTIKTIEGMYSVLAGRLSYGGDSGLFYDSIRGTQNIVRAGLLQGAAVSAMSDVFFGRAVAKMNGISTTGFMKNYFSYLSPFSKEGRRVAKRIAFVSGASNGRGLMNMRHLDDMDSRGATAWLASFTNRASGLQWMTDAIKSALPLETFGFMAEASHTRTAWKDLPDAMKEAFSRWNIDEVDYKNIISSKRFVDEESGADFIRPEDVAESGYLETARKYDLWTQDMALSASNEPRLLTRAISTGAVLGDAKEGTYLKLASSSVMMFKSFGITVVMNHLLENMRHAATARGMSRLSRIAPFLVGTTFYGMMALQAKQIIQGKNPRELDEKLLMASFMQGGGAGIFGDFLFQDTSRFGASFTKTALGPMFGFTDDAFRVFKGNFDKMLDEDDDTNFMSDLFQFSKRYAPAVKLWYVRLLTERLMLDQMERMIDPNFDKRVERMENKIKEETGQEFWWGKGDILPE